VTDLQILSVLAGGAFLLMTRLGLTAKMLTLKHPPRRCGACGRLRRNEVCPWCSRR
jgi:recombinational DNA repair protein RecR